MERLTVIKVGGAIVEDSAQLAQLINDFATLEGRKILVHGGGRRATKVAAQLGIETHMVGGRRITDADMLQVVTMVYGGLVNKQIVAQLQAAGVNAIGLSGADMNVIRSHKRAPKLTTLDDGTQEMVDFGFVGDVDKADPQALAALVESGAVPVIAPLTHDGQGTLLNTNADTMAQTVATALAELYDVTLIYSFEKPGVMRNPDDPSTLISEITPELFKAYVADGTITGGMIPKIENALQAVGSGVKKVVITLATLIDGQHGTMVHA